MVVRPVRHVGLVAGLLASIAAVAQDPECTEGFDYTLEAPGAVDGTLEVPHYWGEVTEFEVFAHLKSDVPGASGVQGFSMSVTHDRDMLDIVEAEALVCPNDPGVLRPDVPGAVHVEIVPPPFGHCNVEIVDNASGAGFICAIVFSFTSPVELPPVSDTPLVRARYRFLPPQLGPGDPPPVALPTTIAFEDGLRGFGDRPVSNVVTYQGATERPCTTPLEVLVTPTETLAFQRGDANYDSRLDISDAITVLNVLFRGTGEIQCEDAADANDDGLIDISDALTIINYLFLGTASLPDPFREVGFDPTREDPLRCRPRR